MLLSDVVKSHLLIKYGTKISREDHLPLQLSQRINLNTPLKFTLPKSFKMICCSKPLVNNTAIKAVVSQAGRKPVCLFQFNYEIISHIQIILLYLKCCINADEYHKPRLKPGNNMPKPQRLSLSERNVYIFQIFLYLSFPKIFQMSTCYFKL